MTGTLHKINNEWHVIYNSLEGEGYHLEELPLIPYEELRSPSYLPFEEGKSVKFRIQHSWEAGSEVVTKVATLISQ